MGLFGQGKDKKPAADPEPVLAYLEEAARAKAPFQLADARGRCLQAVLLGLNLDKGTATFQFSGPLPGEKGGSLSAVFILDGLRIGGTWAILDVRPGQTELALPDGLEIMERRKHPRARLNPREGATLTALTGLFEGTGLTGLIDNLSETGARVRIERALEAKGEKKLAVHTALVAPGHPFDLVKLSKLPRIPGAWECSGKAVYLESSAGTVSLGLAFIGFPPEAMRALRALIGSRAGTAPATLPPKSRRSRKDDPPDSEPLATGEPNPPPPPRLEPAPPPARSEPPAPPRPSEETGPPRNVALIRLKKRSRTLLVTFRPEDPGEDALTAFLTQQGFGRVRVSRTLKELLDSLEDPAPNLILIDGGVAEMEGLDLVGFLQQVVDELPPLILALEAVSEPTVLAARRLNVNQLMVKPYPLDSAFGEALEALLGL